MTSSAARCDEIVALIDSCLAELDTTPTAVSSTGDAAIELDLVGSIR